MRMYEFYYIAYPRDADLVDIVMIPQIIVSMGQSEHEARRIAILALLERGLFIKEIEYKDSYDNSANTLS